MPKYVEVPGHGIVEFPDSLSDDQIGEAIQTHILTPKERAKGTYDAAQARRRALIAEELQRPAFPMRPEMASPEFEGVPSTPDDPGGRMVLTQAIGMGLPMAGTALGTMTPIPGGALLGETAGSVAARRLNVALGLEEPGRVGDIASVVGPAAMKGLGHGIAAVAKRLPGVSYGLQEMGVQQADDLAARLVPRPSADILYDRVAQVNPPVRLNETAKVAGKLLDQQRRLAPQQRSEVIVNAAEGWLDMAQRAPTTDFQDVWLAQKQLRQQMTAAGGLDQGTRRIIDGAIMRDVEATPGPLSAALKAANATYRKQEALKDLTSAIEGNVQRIVQGQGTPRIDAGAIMRRFEKAMREDDLFAGAFNAAELGDIRETLTAIAQLPRMGASPGASYGSGGVAGIGGGATGFALGLDPQTAAAITATMTALPFVLMTEPGRAVVRGLANAGTLLTPTGAAALRGFLQTSGQLAAQ
jgi:hypothetical protein